MRFTMAPLIIAVSCAHAIAAPSSNLRVEEGHLVVNVQSGWRLSSSEANAEALELLSDELADSIDAEPAIVDSRKLRHAVRQLLADDDLRLSTTTNTRDRPYGVLHQVVMHVDAPSEAIDRASKSWAIQVSQRNGRVAYTSLVTLVVLVGLVWGLIVSDRATHGDRRPILYGLFVLECIALASAGCWYCTSTISSVS